MPLLNPGTTRIILASQSPRRIEVLKKIIPHFEVRASHIPEHNNGVTNPQTLVEELSRQKAEHIANQISQGIVIGADSIVVLGDKILGKPKDYDDSYHILRLLSGKVHQVYTGFTIIKQPNHFMLSDYEVTDVKFRQLEPWEIKRYIDSGQARDKAGSYGIQDEGAVFVESINGCFYNVMGLPLTKLFLALKNILTTDETG